MYIHRCLTNAVPPFAVPPAGDMGAPMCMGRLAGDNMERVMYGDSKGCVVLMTCGHNELPARDLIYNGARPPACAAKPWPILIGRWPIPCSDRKPGAICCN